MSIVTLFLSLLMSCGDSTTPTLPNSSCVLTACQSCFRWAALAHMEEAVMDLEGSSIAPLPAAATPSGTDNAVVQADVTMGQETRPCICLESSGRISWTLSIPEGARLQTGYGVESNEPPGGRAARHPRTHFKISLDGTPIWQKSVKPSDLFDDVDLALGRWAGRSVELVLEVNLEKGEGRACWAAPEVYSSGGEEPRRVVVIGIDALRADHLGTHGYQRNTSPEMDAFADTSFVFDNSFAPAPRTRPSFRSAFTGRYPLTATAGMTFGEVLNEAGFVTAGFSGNVHLVPHFGFNRGFSYWFYENGAKADDQVDRALSWLRAHQDREAFLFLHIMDPHIFYNAPGRHKNMFVEHEPTHNLPDKFNRWYIYRQMARGKLDQLDKDFIEARYDGEIHFVSAQLQRLFDALDRLPGRTLTILHTDHGDEFWDHGGFEHNHTLYNELVRTALWFRPPGGLTGGPRRFSDQVGLVDIAPTIYDLLDIPRERWPGMDGTSLRPLLETGHEADARRALLQDLLKERPLHLSYLMYDKERWGVVQDHGKYIIQTVSGQEELYDLATDPTESHNLALQRASELPRWRQRLALATGWQVGPGLRISFSLHKESEISIRFSSPVADADLYDPESSSTRRANLELGQKPRIEASSVADVLLSPDRTTVTIRARSRPRGSAWVLFSSDSPPPDSAQLLFQGQVKVLTLESRENNLPGLGTVQVEPGTVIAARGYQLHDVKMDQVDQDSMEALKALGYLE